MSERNEAADELAQYLRNTGRVGPRELLIAALAHERQQGREEAVREIRTAMSDDGGFEGENLDIILDAIAKSDR